MLFTVLLQTPELVFKKIAEKAEWTTKNVYCFDFIVAESKGQRCSLRFSGTIIWLVSDSEFSGVLVHQGVDWHFAYLIRCHLNQPHSHDALFLIRNIRLLIILSLMDTSLPHNSDLVARIKQEALSSGFFEAFMESAPQFILQCIIILRTGCTSENCSINLFYFGIYRYRS